MVHVCVCVESLSETDIGYRAAQNRILDGIVVCGF
jgi:hypothetical protein